MEQVFEALGLAGLTPTFQWAVLVWFAICVGVIPLELYWWFSLRRSRGSIDLGKVAAGAAATRPAFLGEDGDRKQERIARGDAYAGPSAASPANAPATVAKVSRWRRLLFFALLLATMCVVGWLIFGDPFVAIEDAVDLGSARTWKDVLASCWMLVAVSVARVAMWVYELKAG